MLWRRLILAGLAVTFSGLVCAELRTGLRLEHDDRVRSYDLFIPSQPDSNPRPLVLDLHGVNGNPSQQRNISGLAQIANENNFFAAWPAGFQARWNYVIGEGGIDDVGFLRALVARISSRYAIDPARVYVTGFSQGGLMVNRLACEADDLFAAFASVAGSMVGGNENDCSPLRPVPMLAWLEEGFPSDNEAFDFWRVKNDCSSTVDRLDLGSILICDEARNCGQETRTRACTVRGAASGPHVIYDNTAGLDLSQENWNFFAPFAHPNPSVGSFTINAGLNDAWYYKPTDGQGFFITVFPDLGYVSLAWFTYDTELPSENATAILGDPGHRWLTALGPIDGDQVVMSITMTSGGIFDDPTEVDRTDPPGSDGTITLTFDSCSAGTIEYEIPSINRQGVIPIERVVDDNIMICEALSLE